MTARAPLPDYDDSCPTLEIPTPFAPSSGVWPSQPAGAVSLDPANSTLLDAVVPGALSTWQRERLLAADASLALAPTPAPGTPAAQGRVRPRTSTAPMPRSFAPCVSPDASIPPNGTISPDGTLLPWRHERPPSRRGTVALALVFALVASAGVTVGFMRSTTQPLAVAARVVRTPTSGIRQLLLEDSTEIKRETPPTPPARAARRPARPSKAEASEPSTDGASE
jgi:hypothetical protein